MPNYVKIPREIIYNKDIGDKRTIIFSYLCSRRALDDTVAFSISELCHWSHLKPNYHDGKINHKYLAHLIQSTKVQILRIANFSTLPIINQDRTGSLNIVVPPISEQESIVNILENKSAPINAAIKAAEKQISLLQERKKIIINDVVTGKVKVC